MTDKEWSEVCWEYRQLCQYDELRIAMLAWADEREEQGDKWKIASGLRILANWEDEPRFPWYNTLKRLYTWTNYQPSQGTGLSRLPREVFDRCTAGEEFQFTTDRLRGYPMLESAIIDACWSVAKIDC